MLDEIWMSFASYFTQPPVSLSEAAAEKLDLPKFQIDKKSKKRPGASGPRMAQLLSCHDQRVRISMGGWCVAVVAPVAPVGFTIFPPNNLALKGDLTYVLVYIYCACIHCKKALLRQIVHPNYYPSPTRYVCICWRFFGDVFATNFPSVANKIWEIKSTCSTFR